MNAAPKILCIALAFALAACSSGSMEKVESGHSTSFDGEVLRIEFEREDGGKERFSALRDRWYAWSWVPFLPNHSGRRWVMGKTDREGTSIAYALVSWDNDEPTDYLAAGYWMRFDGFDRDRGLPIAAADLVMFIDGSEIDPALPPELPVSGTASYTGQAGGIYTYSYGGGWNGYDGPDAGEEFYGPMTVEANFDDMTVAGCIGCVGDLWIEREHLYSVLGRRGRRAARHAHRLRNSVRPDEDRVRRQFPGRRRDGRPSDADRHAVGWGMGRQPFQPPGVRRQTALRCRHRERRVHGGRWQRGRVQVDLHRGPSVAAAPPSSPEGGPLRLSPP